MDSRAVVLIHWLEAQLLIDTLEDFHNANIYDGILFELVIGEAIDGLGSVPKGIVKIQSWVNQGKASTKTNLVWRSIALNQEQAITEIDKVIAEAQGHQAVQTLASTFDWIGYTGKTLKAFASTYKSAFSIMNDNNSANSARGDRAFGAKINSIKMRGVDKVMITAGDFIYKHFKVDGLAAFTRSL